MLFRSLSSFPVEQADELGMIARNLRELGRELETARRRADRLEKSVPDAVAQETKRMSRLLQNAERDAGIDSLTKNWEKLVTSR